MDFATKRKAVTNLLKQKYKPSFAKKYEKDIFDMCQRLSTDYEEGIEEIYAKFAYEKVGQFLAAAFYKEAIVEDIKNDVLNWDASVYAELRDKVTHENDLLTEEIKVEKGEFPCRNRDCKSQECYTYQMNSRSLDEGAITHVVCTKCGHRYKFG